jgi:ribosomal protein L16 Arg81 hydroxylase
VWLAPPSFKDSMYPYPPPPTPSDVTQAETGNTSPSMSNTSQVDVFCSSHEAVHPEFWEKVVPHAMSATLNPGDMLFFPPGWWHAMRSESTSFSVSMWF